jgi:hypothetical protein
VPIPTTDNFNRMGIKSRGTRFLHCSLLFVVFMSLGATTLAISTAPAGADATPSQPSWWASDVPYPSTNAAGVHGGWPTLTPAVTALTCPSSDVCVAVGSYLDQESRYWPIISVLADSKWTSLAAPEPSTNGSGEPASLTDSGTKHEDAVLTSVSCSSATSCVGDH